MNVSSVPQLQTMQQTEQQFIQLMQYSDSPEAALRSLLQTVTQSLNAEGWAVGVTNANQQLLRVLSWETESSAALFRGRDGFNRVLSLLDCFTDVSLSLSSPHSICLSDIDNHSSHPAPNLLIIGTHYQGHLNGVLMLVRSQPYAWAEEDVKQFQSVSQQVAIAISHMQLQQQLQQQSGYQFLLDQLTIDVRSNLPLGEVLQRAIEGVVNCLSLQRATVLLAKYASPQVMNRNAGQMAKAKFVVECEFGSIDHSAQGDHPPSHKTAASRRITWLRESFAASDCAILQHAVEMPTRQFIFPSPPGETCQELDGDSAVLSKHFSSEEVAPLFCLETMPALALIPIEHQTVLLGYLSLQATYPRPWQPEELAFLRLVAAQLSTAIIQSNTMRQVHSLVDERTSQLKRSLDVQAKLYEKTRQQVEQLRRMNQIMEEFLSTVSHELLTPLTSMKLAIRMLREANLSPEQQTRYLNILEQQCAQETQLINDLLALQRLDRKTENLQLQQIDLRHFIRDLQETWSENLQERSLTLEVDLPARPLLVKTDPDSLNRILLELLTNAKKYSDPGSQVVLTVMPETNKPVPEVEIAVQNVGAGIAPEEMPIIFEKFRRGTGATQKAIPGIGLGLALVKGLIAHLSGSITASSDPLPDSDLWQTRMTLVLPQSPELL